MAKRPTRLELHRLKYCAAEGKHPLIPWKDLSDFEKNQFSTSFFQALFVDKQKRDPYVVYADELSNWGIMCPHPQHKRLYGGTVRSEVPVGSHRWYLCECCASHCPNDALPDWLVGKASGGR
jgi:hypothetical protein